ncbi:MAG: hypothetical protein ACTHU0_39695 [Kofleriaceae bacterium]
MSFERMKLHSWEEFQIWLASDVEARDELAATMKAKLGVGIESLDAVEKFLVGRYKTIAQALKSDQRDVLDGVARHIGLVFLLNVDGAEWGIDLEDDDNVYYQLPIIRIADGPEECPLSMATTCIDRRTGSFLRDVVQSYADDYNASPKRRSAAKTAKARPAKKSAAKARPAKAGEPSAGKKSAAKARPAKAGKKSAAKARPAKGGKKSAAKARPAKKSASTRGGRG